MNIPAIALIASCLQTWIPGPLAVELAVVAEQRRAHEDGPNRAEDESVPGVGLDPVHTQLLAKVKEQFPLLRHDLVTGDAASGGTMRLYRLKGPNAQIAGAVLVGLVLDSYPERFAARSEVWWRNRVLSEIISESVNDSGCRSWIDMREERTEALGKLNRMFGPWPYGGVK